MKTKQLNRLSILIGAGLLSLTGCNEPGVETTQGAVSKNTGFSRAEQRKSEDGKQKAEKERLQMQLSADLKKAEIAAETARINSKNATDLRNGQSENNAEVARIEADAKKSVAKGNNRTQLMGQVFQGGSQLMVANTQANARKEGDKAKAKAEEYRTDKDFEVEMARIKGDGYGKEQELIIKAMENVKGEAESKKNQVRARHQANLIEQKQQLEQEERINEEKKKLVALADDNNDGWKELDPRVVSSASSDAITWFNRNKINATPSDLQQSLEDTSKVSELEKVNTKLSAAKSGFVDDEKVNQMLSQFDAEAMGKIEELQASVVNSGVDRIQTNKTADCLDKATSKGDEDKCFGTSASPEDKQAFADLRAALVGLASGKPANFNFQDEVRITVAYKESYLRLKAKTQSVFQKIGNNPVHRFKTDDMSINGIINKLEGSMYTTASYNQKPSSEATMGILDPSANDSIFAKTNNNPGMDSTFNTEDPIGAPSGNATNECLRGIGSCG